MEDINSTATILGFKPHDPTTTATEKLDAVLIHFESLKKSPPQYPYVNELTWTYYKLPKDIILTTWERDLIISKLEKDKYIDLTEMGTPTSSGKLPHYKINFDGLLFLQKGGYTQ